MAADQVLYSQALESQDVSTPMIRKTVQYVTDLNNNSYGSGQVLIDTSSLSNSGRWCAYSDAYLEVPLVAALYPSAAVTNFDENKNLQFSCGLKNGTIQLIHSLSLELNNANVIQLTPYTNFYLNYKLMTTFSQEDLSRWGSSLCFYPDTADAFAFNTSASPEGLGSSNNRTFGWQNIYPSNGGRIFTAAQIAAGASPVTISTIVAGGVVDSLYTTNFPDLSGTSLSTGNFGLYKRTKQWAFNVDSSQYTNLLTEASTKTLWKNYFQSDTTNHAKVWYMLAHIKLRHISDLFQNLCISRGIYLRFIINMNVGTAKLTSALVGGVAGVTGAGGYTGAYGSPAYTTFTLASAPTLSQGSTFPLIFASSSPGEPNALLDTTGSKTWYLGCGIVRYTQVAGGASYTTPGTFTHQSTTVRLYVPTYTLSEQAESALLEINGAVKTIVYEDILQYNIPATPSGSSVNQLLTNGVVSPVKLVILPMFTAATAGNGTPFAAPYASPFAAEPGLTSPLTAITNFNLLLSGETVLMLNQQYDFQNFIDEFSHSGINGGVTDGLSSGLVDEYTWSNSYRAYVVDIERRVSAGDAVVPKSIQILFQNLSAREVQYFCFVVVRRAFSIDLRNGSLVS
jgi:hypothetical protein